MTNAPDFYTLYTSYPQFHKEITHIVLEWYSDELINWANDRGKFPSKLKKVGINESLVLKTNLRTNAQVQLGEIAAKITEFCKSEGREGLYSLVIIHSSKKFMSQFREKLVPAYAKNPFPLVNTGMSMTELVEMLNFLVSVFKYYSDTGKNSPEDCIKAAVMHFIACVYAMDPTDSSYSLALYDLDYAHTFIDIRIVHLLALAIIQELQKDPGKIVHPTMVQQLHIPTVYKTSIMKDVTAISLWVELFKVAIRTQNLATLIILLNHFIHDLASQIPKDCWEYIVNIVQKEVTNSEITDKSFLDSIVEFGQRIIPSLCLSEIPSEKICDFIVWVRNINLLTKI